MMILNRWISALRERVRAFLGLDVLPTRSETIALRDDMAKYHREILDLLTRQAKVPFSTHTTNQFVAPTLDWEMVQKLELLNMLENPQKED